MPYASFWEFMRPLWPAAIISAVALYCLVRMPS